MDSLLARARAAERTVEVLKRKVVELYNGGGSIIQHAAQRAQAREAEMRRRQELADLRNNELARYNVKLEAEVAERTRDLQVILDNVVFGFLVVNRDGTVRDGFTRSCTGLLGCDRVAGQRFVEVMNLQPSQRDDFALQLDQVFDDVLPEALTLDQLPRRSTSPDGRSLEIEGRVIRHADGTPDGVLFTITDVTELEHAHHETAHYRLIVDILRHSEAFDAFMLDYRGLAAAGRAAVDAGDQHAARRAVHTMKGNAACFGLTPIVELAHRLEDSAMIDRAAIEQLDGALREFCTANADVLRSSHEAGPRIQLTAAELDDLEALAVRDPAAISAWVAKARCWPVRSMLGPIEALVPRLAERLGKQVALVIEGSELRVDPELLRPVMLELSHLVRNAIDHGIEPRDERAGKPQTGQVTIRIGEEYAAYKLEIADDGRGIDVERVIAKARVSGLCDHLDLARLTRDELLGLVFLDGLSTLDAASSVSGRGVGMSAIRNAVGSVGGTIRLHSNPGAGTRIEITIPHRRARSPSAIPVSKRGASKTSPISLR